MVGNASKRTALQRKEKIEINSYREMDLRICYKPVQS